MAILTWNTDTVASYEAGVSQGVVYYVDGTAEAWNGLIGVDPANELELQEAYFEGRLSSNALSQTDFKLSVECYTYPPRLLTDRVRAISYAVETAVGKKVHIVYNPKIHMSSRSYTTYQEEADISTFDLDVSTVPESLDGYAPSAHAILDTNRADSTGGLETILEMLYGTFSKNPSLPSLEFMTAVAKNPGAIDLLLIDHGDGTFTVSGGSVLLDSIDTFIINHPSVTLPDGDTYLITTPD